MRISKSPEVRKQEILDTAMRLFYEKGYEATSMADIAKEMQVVQGLCYRYFASKQALYEEAMMQYAEAIANQFLPILHEDTRTLQERLERIMQRMVELESHAKYHEFYHKKGNEQAHLQLSLAISQYLHPHFLSELEKAEAANHLRLRNPSYLLSFLSYGILAFMKEDAKPLEERLALALHYINVLFQAEAM